MGPGDLSGQVATQSSLQATRTTGAAQIDVFSTREVRNPEATYLKMHGLADYKLESVNSRVWWDVDHGSSFIAGSSLPVKSNWCAM
jgi:hypothetical protein